MQKELTESVPMGKDTIFDFSPLNIDGEEKTDQNKKKQNIVSAQEYRELFEDTMTTDKQIEQKLNYLEALCRNVIRAELETICRQK